MPTKDHSTGGQSPHTGPWAAPSQGPSAFSINHRFYLGNTLAATAIPRLRSSHPGAGACCGTEHPCLSGGPHLTRRYYAPRDFLNKAQLPADLPGHSQPRGSLHSRAPRAPRRESSKLPSPPPTRLPTSSSIQSHLHPKSRQGSPLNPPPRRGPCGFRDPHNHYYPHPNLPACPSRKGTI